MADRMTVADSWKRVEAWLSVNVSAGSFKLPQAASNADIERAETAMGCRMPEDVHESYRIHNGSNRIWLFQQGFLMPLGGASAEGEDYTVVGLWTGMLQCMETMKNERGTPKGPIKTDWWNQGWIPLTENEGGDYICIDLVPETGGHVGQVIDWWHEQAATAVLANSWADWLANLATQLEAGKCRFDPNGSGTIQPTEP
jgi:cell wall assembly regulator SMI1